MREASAWKWLRWQSLVVIIILTGYAERLIEARWEVLVFRHCVRVVLDGWVFVGDLASLARHQHWR